MAHRLRPGSWLALARRLRRETGTSTLEFAVGAALAVGAVAALSSGFQGSVAGAARRVAAALNAPAASASDPSSDAMGGWQARIDELEEQVAEAREAAEEASDDRGFWDQLGSIFGSQPVGTAVGSAIGDSAEASESDDADAARELERATLEAEAVPGWSRDDDD
jgi:hypothetical protein